MQRSGDVAGGADGADGADGGGVALRSGPGRALLAAAVCGSAAAFLDAQVVSVALPAIGRDLSAGLGVLQWTVNAYTLVLAGLVLLGGALGDRFGRRRTFTTGVVWFAVASAACAAAPTAELLVAARALQGVGGALLTPMSLALLQTSLRPGDRARAIGTWSGATTLATVAAPVVGGALVALDWRLVFLLNLPVAAVAVALVRRAPADPPADPSGGAAAGGRPGRPGRLDVLGAALGAAALGSLTWALTEAGSAGASPAVLAAVAAAVVLGGAFLLRERRASAPVVPLGLFADRVFAVTNAYTLLVYAALSGASLLLVLQLQVSLGWTPLQAGLATLPSSLLLGLLSGRAGALGQRVGPRRMLVGGAVLAAAGFALLSSAGPGDAYATAVLPGVVAMGLGFSAFVAPLTASVLAAAPQRLAGAASGVNNAVARTAGLLAVAALPAVAGISGSAYTDPAALTPAYRTAVLVCAGLVLAGAASALLLPGRAGGRGAVAGPARPREPAAPGAR